VSVGIYPTNSAEQVKYVLDHSQSRFVVVKDQEQADKVLQVKEELTLLQKIIVIDMKGLRHYNERLIISYQDVEALGREALRKDPGAFLRLVGEGRAEDVAFIVYTSGTTGHPKGAMLSHRNVIHQTLYALQPVLNFSDRDTLLSYLPLCHILERSLTMSMPLVFGYTVNFAESIDTVQQNIQEIRPTFFAAVPRILEKLYSSVQIKIADTTRFKRWMYDLWKPVGLKVSGFKMNNERVPLPWLILYVFGYLFSFRSVRDKVGMLNCRTLMSGGAPIAPEVLTFFRSLGVRTVEMYGATETSGTISGPHKKIKHGSVGEPCQGLEFRLADDGEIQVKGDSIFVGYYRDAEATCEVVCDGWYCTGDVGQLDEDNHLYIVDRKKDIIITSGGKNISPSEIENKLKCSMYIKEAIAIGDRRKYVSALVQIDYENVGNWAQKNKIAYTTYRSLAENPKVKELIKQEIDLANEGLANVESVKKFKILEKELDQDDEELTATQKVKRKTIEKRFVKEIEEMYGGR
jgi:long-chain acyl-CoA synthetase